MQNDSELTNRYRLDPAGTMFVVNLIGDVLTSHTQRSNARNESDHHTKILVSWKNATVQQ